jgi:hypothetical protein
MLYLVGGASRAGKSRLARKLLTERQIPYFSLDILMMGLRSGYPAYGLDPETSAVVRGEHLWPIVRAMAVNILEEALVHPAYLLEGDELLPRHVSELCQAYPGQVRACFIGYNRLDPCDKLRDIRRCEADWCSTYSEAQALAFLADQVEFSRYLERECAGRGLRYLDGSEDMMAVVAEAAEALTGQKGR